MDIGITIDMILVDEDKLRQLLIQMCRPTFYSTGGENVLERNVERIIQECKKKD